jgi:7-carboxy-7-deazaguanine synthase
MIFDNFMKYNLTEIFYSLQGEGFWTGLPAVFIRFAGCNLNCTWCDTDYTQRMQLTAPEILLEIQQYPSAHIVLTGGEPTLQLTPDLIQRLHQAGKYLHLETNGTMEPPPGLDWITISPKEMAFWEVRQAQELKLVYTGQPIEPFQQAAHCQYYFLQPCSMSNIPETIAKVKQCPPWRLSLQTHKLLNIL